MNVKELINHEIGKAPELISRLVRSAGFTSDASLQSFLEQPEQDFQSFDQLVRMIQEIFPEQEGQMIHDYLNAVNPTHPFVRWGLEYASINRDFGLMQTLIEKLNATSSKQNKEWAYFYSLDRVIKQGEFSPSEIQKQILMSPTTTFEMKVFSKFLLIYVYHSRFLNMAVFEFIKSLEPLIYSIQDEYIKNSYLIRFGIIMSFSHLHKNNLTASRTYGEFVLSHSHSPNLEAIMNHHLGSSYFFESYERSISYLRRAREILLSIHSDKVRNVEKSINFVQIYWRIEPEFLDDSGKDVSDLYDIIYYYIQKSERDKALSYLNHMDVSALNDYYKGFHYCFQGMIMNEKKYFYLSIYHFKNIREIFYRQLPLQELKNRGEEDLALKALEA